MGMINLFKRMFSMDESLVPDTLTNQRVLDEMIELFSQQLRYRSVRKTMIFPMTFILYVHPSDYENLKESFPIFFPEVVDGFYEVVRKSIPLSGRMQRSGMHTSFLASPKMWSWTKGR